MKWDPLRNTLEEEEDEEAVHECVVPEEMVDEATFKRLVKIHEHRVLDTYYVEPPVPIKSANFKDSYKFDGYEALVMGPENSVANIFALMKLADYLHDEFVMKMTAIKLATMLFDKTQEQVAEILDIKSDLESPEYLEFRQQNVWVEETDRATMLKRMNEIKNVDVDTTMDPR